MRQTVTFVCDACGATYREAVAGEEHCRRCETNARVKHQRHLAESRPAPHLEGYDRAVAF